LFVSVVAPFEMRVGVISDTHGLLRPEAIAALRGSDLIVHAGDIGRLDVLEQLRDLAPTHACWQEHATNNNNYRMTPG
jgi:predicted phosphodiesterase